MWLSSWALQIFQHGSFQDWENEFFVEGPIFARVIQWILKYQNLDGSFSETEHYEMFPVNKKMGYMVSSSVLYNFRINMCAIYIFLHCSPLFSSS